ncbi:hypothetical protein BT96DRAFT_947324 [Gymnopus androsaceus JB14]|uniref:Uncharacterized protein n=1 Tax=Gymnopus androsaceus JB14 TaxID=1447944 RepID=A0A6A4GSS3_9AGAR|nr:hypothetical protein BT96DRAFT_947324 [Gymnopus androsaceus JB14]
MPAKKEEKNKPLSQSQERRDNAGGEQGHRRNQQCPQKRRKKQTVDGHRDRLRRADTAPSSQTDGAAKRDLESSFGCGGEEGVAAASRYARLKKRQNDDSLGWTQWSVRIVSDSTSLALTKPFGSLPRVISSNYSGFVTCLGHRAIIGFFVFYCTVFTPLIIFRMGSTLKSYDGLVGRRYPELGIFLTSPNMDTMTEPLLGDLTVRLRRDFHYGEHDPIYMPQLFHESTAYLTCIPFPGTGDNLIFWLLPDEATFEPIPGQALSNVPLGLLPTYLLEHLDSAASVISDRINSPTPVSAPANAPGPSSLTNDTKIKEYRARFGYIMSCLRSPSTFPEAFMLFRIAQ